MDNSRLSIKNLDRYLKLRDRNNDENFKHIILSKKLLQ